MDRARDLPARTAVLSTRWEEGLVLALRRLARNGLCFMSFGHSHIYGAIPQLDKVVAVPGGKRPAVQRHQRCDLGFRRLWRVKHPDQYGRTREPELAGAARFDRRIG